MTVEITTHEELRELLGTPAPRAAAKERTRLHERDRQWLAASPFCLVATAGADGTCDVSPKGDPPGFALVLDDTTIAIPERPGNKRADGYRNILDNPHVGLIFLIPGRTDTLRINGRARLLRDAPFFDSMVVSGHRPVLAVVVEIEQIFYHCAKAFLRSDLWRPETWSPEVLPSRARLVKEVEAPAENLADLERHYGPEYARRLYV
ncbi:pyridoxamine 5'-phosphate oxidase family protein [Micromonospora sp. WMMD558]|uniref:pyridoxamine 5'-phosphate oxidase family protein n=1 Tax=unclassified Micromonospora TaxID=2617518 RepID=UPI0012B4981A|nr:pyridoxamine 5'-phosphate oxidase family protein [Micromonospora sp. WMMC415]QGN45777.1 pyridoxamine 5'-phosphate oxidase family protein [Micromonospora sp. WMMC415]